MPILPADCHSSATKGVLRAARSLGYLSSCLLLIAGIPLFGQSVTVQNVTAAHAAISPNLLVGDYVLVEVFGTVGQSVTLSQSVNGGAFSSQTSEGSIQASQSSGGYNCTGCLMLGPAQEQSSNAGAYVQRWYVGGVLANPTVAFTVSSAPIAQLTNTTHPNLNSDLQTGFVVNDDFTLNVVGGDSQTVGVTIYLNGSLYATVPNYGTTNSGGLFSTSGQFTGSSVGNWSETYTVGGIQAGPIVNFSVESQQTAVTIQNQTHTSSPDAFATSDSCLISISNAPASLPVTLSVNGGPFTSMGTSTSSGTFSYTASGCNQAAGRYTEVWAVDNLPANPISFTVTSSSTTAKDYIRLNGRLIAIENHN
jgi:hypothetical protein